MSLHCLKKPQYPESPCKHRENTQAPGNSSNPCRPAVHVHSHMLFKYWFHCLAVACNFYFFFRGDGLSVCGNRPEVYFMLFYAFTNATSIQVKVCECGNNQWQTKILQKSLILLLICSASVLSLWWENQGKTLWWKIKQFSMYVCVFCVSHLTCSCAL